MRIAQVRSTALPLPEAEAQAQAQARGLTVAPNLVHLVLRRSVPIVAGMMVLLVLLSGLALQRDKSAEVDGALATARVSRYLSNLSQLNDVQALAVLRGHAELRHLALRVTDGHYLTLLGSDAPVSATERAVSWTVTRPQGLPWTVTLAATSDSQYASALRLLLEVLAMLALGCAALLGTVAWTLRRALAPLPMLDDALRSLQTRPAQAPNSAGQAPGQPAAADLAQRLPTLLTPEFERLAQSVRELASHMDERDAAQRRHASRAQQAHEAECQRLAAEMHDEFAQRLTALRLDTTWMRRRLQGNSGFDTVIASMLGQLGRLQQELRGWVSQLHPLLPQRAPGETGVPHLAPQPATPQRLRELLLQLAESTDACTGLRVSLDFEADTAHLPQSVLLSVLRMTQEALDNVQRHAQARCARIEVRIDGRAGLLHWSVSDDGRGGLNDLAAAAARGTGLSALQQHAWAHGGDLSLSPGTHGRGLRVQAWQSLEAS